MSAPPKLLDASSTKSTSLEPRFQSIKVWRCRELIATGPANSGSAVPEEPNHFRRWGPGLTPAGYEMMTALAEDAIEADQASEATFLVAVEAAAMLVLCCSNLYTY